MLVYHLNGLLGIHFHISYLLFARFKHFYDRFILTQADAAGLRDGHIGQAAFLYLGSQGIEHRTGTAGNAARSHTNHHADVGTALIS